MEPKRYPEPVEIGSLDEKGTPVSGDNLIIEDSADGDTPKRAQVGNLPGGGDMAAATYDPATIAEQLVGLTATQTLSNKTATTLGVGASPSTLDTLDVDGSILLEHTAAEADDHALEIDCDAAGFSDVKALDIDYISGAIGATEDEAIILVNLDESAATGGDITALEILATEGSAQINGLFVGALVNPVEQLSGVFTDADTVLNKAVDVTTDVSGGGAGNISIFVADNDTLTIGSSAKFEELEFLLDTGSSGAGIAPTWEYSTGVGTWATFGPVDGTNGFRNTGVAAWLDSDIPSWAVGTGTEFLIRITRTRNSLSTTPIVDKIQVTAATLFSWDKDGDVEVNSVITDTISERTAAAGVTIDGLLVKDSGIPEAAVTAHEAALSQDYLDASDAAGSTAISGTTTVPIDTSNVSSDPADFSIASNEITFENTGTYFVMHTISTDNTSTTRSETRGWLQTWNGSTWTTATRTIGNTYNRTSAVGAGQIVCHMMVQAVGGTTKVRAQCAIVAGSNCSLIDSQCAWSIFRVSKT